MLLKEDPTLKKKNVSTLFTVMQECGSGIDCDQQTNRPQTKQTQKGENTQDN